MSAGLLVITHGECGETLLSTAVEILGVCPLPAKTLAVSSGDDPDRILEEAKRLADDIGAQDGVLVLTDLYGSTPSNIACRLLNSHEVRVIAGVNLPMLVRVLNYPDLHLDQLVHKALSGGRDGVLVCRNHAE